MSETSDRLEEARELEEAGNFEEAARIYDDIGLDSLADAARESAEEEEQKT